MTSTHITLVNVYVDLLVFTRIAGTSWIGSGRYWCSYYIEKHAICLKDYRIRSFLRIWHAHGDLCKHLGTDSSSDLDDRYSNLFLNAYINDRFSNLFLNAYINLHAHTEYL